MTELLSDANFKNQISEGVTLVDFYASWCNPCKMIAPVIDELSNEVQGAKVVKVDVDNSPEVSSEYGIRSVPTFILFKDGKIVERIAGANPSKDFYLDLIEKAK